MSWAAWLIVILWLTALLLWWDTRRVARKFRRDVASFQQRHPVSRADIDRYWDGYNAGLKKYAELALSGNENEEVRNGG